MKNHLLFLQIHHAEALGHISQAATGGCQSVRSFRFGLAPDTPESSEDEWASALQAALRQPRRAAPRRCVLVLHRRDVAILHLNLPPGDDAEIQAMLELQLAERLPLALADICFGWERLGGGPPPPESAPPGSTPPPRNVQVYWAPRSRIQPRIDRLQEAGLEVAAVLPATAANRHLLARHGNGQKDNGEDSGAPAEQRSQALIQLSANSAELVLWDCGGGIVFSRGRQLPRAAGEDDSPGLEPLGAAMAEAVATCQKLPQWDNVAGFYSGPADPPATLRPHVSAWRQLEYANGAAPVNGRGKDSGEMEETPLPLAAAALLIGETDSWRKLKGAAARLDMLPSQIAAERRHSRSRRLLRQSLLLVFGLLALVLANLWLYVHQLEAQLTENKAAMAQLAPAADEVAAMRERISSIREQIDYVISPLDALDTLNRILADNQAALKGLYISKLVYSASGDIILEGHAQNGITPWEFTAAIVKDGTFERKEPPRISFHSYGDHREIRFRLVIGVRQTGRAKR